MDNKTIRSIRRTVVFSHVMSHARELRKAVSMDELIELTGYTNAILMADLERLERENKIKQTITTCDKSQWRPTVAGWVPMDTRLSYGLGDCSTDGCGGRPIMIVAGNLVCRRCFRGPVSEEDGGGVFREPGSEENIDLNMNMISRDASQSTGGWIPEHDKKKNRHY